MFSLLCGVFDGEGDHRSFSVLTLSFPTVRSSDLEVPRRRLRAFRDLFSKGFAFNRMGGTIAFGGGQARSDDMNIDGPAAEIRIHGSADLRAERSEEHTIELTSLMRRPFAVFCLKNTPHS